MERFWSLIGFVPESDVVPDKLEDHGAVLVVFLVDSVYVGDGLFEGSIRELKSLLGLIFLLVQEHGHVEMQTEPDRIGLGQVGPGQVVCFLVAGSGCVPVVAVTAVLAQVPIIVPLKF